MYIDGTLIHTYTGDSTTLPDNVHTWRFEQQMHNPNGTPPPSSDSEDWQIASITIDTAN
jgi:hypothetical protein